jgi:hypothetical protein
LRNLRHILVVGGFVLLGTFVVSGDSSERSREDPFEYGLPINPYDLERPELERALDMAEDAGANSISTGAVWWHIAPEPTTESYRWSALDLLADEAQERGLRLKVQISGTPDWVHPQLKQRESAPVRRRWHPPRGPDEMRHFEDFVRTLVERYGTQVDRYEIWNEPNLREYWEPEPDPGEYAALLRVAYTSIKQADPEVTVVFGGLARNDLGFLDSYYDAARQYPGAAENRYFFDVLGLHPYTRGPSGIARSPDWARPASVIQEEFGPLDYSFMGMTKMKSLMERNRDKNKPIYIGEFGYTTVDDERINIRAVPDERRALYLKRAYALARNLPYVEGMCWYAYVPTVADGPGWTIVDSDWNPSLTYHALKQVTESEEPAVTLNAPQGPVSGSYLLNPKLSNISHEDVSRWELYVDGIPVRTYEDYPKEWDSRNVPDGEHHLILAAYTEDGSVWPSNKIFVTVRNIGVDSLSTDAQSYAAGSLIEFRATLSAGTTTTVDQITIAVRSRDTGETYDLPPVGDYTVGTEPETLSFERKFDRSGTYVYWVAYRKEGTWYDMTPQKWFAVEERSKGSSKTPSPRSLAARDSPPLVVRVYQSWRAWPGRTSLNGFGSVAP